MIKNIDYSKSSDGNDYGRGFYTTILKEKADECRTKALQSRVYGKTTQ